MSRMEIESGSSYNPKRRRGQARRAKTDAQYSINIDELVHLYVNYNCSLRELSRRFGFDKSVAKLRLIEYGVLRTPHEAESIGARQLRGKPKSVETRHNMARAQQRRALLLSTEERQQRASVLEQNVRQMTTKDKAAANKKRVISGKRYWDNCSPEARQARLLKGWHSNLAVLNRAISNIQKPNKIELFMIEFLAREYPNEWAYNGDGRLGFVIGGRVPDFVNINGRKAVIEVFGRYWHKEVEVEEKIAHYQQFGFDCIVLWEDECLESDVVKEKLEGSTRRKS